MSYNLFAMADLFQHSMFYEVLFPPSEDTNTGTQELTLQKLKRFLPDPSLRLEEVKLVVFDLETTGLDYEADRIIEIGAIKLENFKPVGEFSSLVKTDIEFTDDIVRLTGITREMLANEGEDLNETLGNFLKFIDGCILVAHNAAFDFTMIKRHYNRMGVELEWATFCTLKLAREFLAQLENKKLDTLAEHYGLQFEARHRSIGDVKVTCSVLENLMTKEAQNLKNWADITPFRVDL